MAQQDQRPVPPGEASANAVVDVLRGYGLNQPNLLLRIAQQVDQLVQRLTDVAPGGGFDPLSGRPSVSNMQYTHQARTADELRETQDQVPGGNHEKQQRSSRSSMPWMRP